MRTKVRKLHQLVTPEVPGPNWQAVGVTPDGKHLWQITTKRSRPVPLFDTSPEAQAYLAELRQSGKSDDEITSAMRDRGFRQYRRALATGEPIYPLNRPEIYDHTEVFYTEDQGNGNRVKVPYREPTAEEKARLERQAKIDAMRDTLPALLVDRGLTADDLARFAAGNGSEPEEPESNDFPQVVGRGWYLFSDGEKRQFKREEDDGEIPAAAYQYEAALLEARKTAETVPEV